MTKEAFIDAFSHEARRTVREQLEALSPDEMERQLWYCALVVEVGLALRGAPSRTRTGTP